MNVIEMLNRDRLMVLARGVRKDVLVKGVGAIADAGVTVFESTFDHRREDCVAENADKIAALDAEMEQYACDAVKLGELFQQKQETEELLEQEMLRWEELSLVLEENEV